MDFDTWTTTGVDRVRLRRLAVGYVVGAFSVTLATAFIFYGSKGKAAEEEEDPTLQAQFATEPEPEPEPEPAPEPEQPKPKPRAPKVSAPLDVPDAPLKEADPTGDLNKESDPFGGKEEAAPVETAKPTVVEALPAPKPKAPPKPSGPIRVTEDVTPPEPLSQVMPEHPAAAKAAGIEGVVIVKYIVSESGSVSEARVMKGPPELAGACLAAVKTWRFRPAMLEGKVVSVVRIHRFRFRIKT